MSAAASRAGRPKLSHRPSGPALTINVVRDGDGEGSPRREAAIGLGVLAIVIAVCLVLILWSLDHQDWLGLR